MKNVFSFDDYAKDGGPGEVWLTCSFYHESLRTWIKTIVYQFAISYQKALILGVHALRSYLKLICELYELHTLPNKKLVAQRIMVKTTSRSDRSWSAIFCVIVYWCPKKHTKLTKFKPCFCSLHYNNVRITLIYKTNLSIYRRSISLLVQSTGNITCMQVSPFVFYLESMMGIMGLARSSLAKRNKALFTLYWIDYRSAPKTI